MDETQQPSEPLPPDPAWPYAGRMPAPPPLIVAANRAQQMAEVEAAINRHLREASRPPRRRLRTPIVLFVATLLSTFLVGANYMPLLVVVMELMGLRGPFHDAIWASLPAAILNGLLYSVPLMAILLAHEMGHYLMARWNRVPASLPYFIPLPLPPLGTMGAVIFQQRGSADRKQMFDVAIWGPLAGLIVTIPVLLWGILHTRYIFVPPNGGGLEFGEPLLFQWLVRLVLGPKPPGMEVVNTPLLMAGWVGVFITALNLFPVGQLDGGHILYCLIGRKAHYVAMAIVGAAAAIMFLTGQYAYVLMLALLIFTGPRHPPTKDDTVPLGVIRHIMGWLTLSFLVIGFTPRPIIVPDGPQPDEQSQKSESSNQGIHQPAALAAGSRSSVAVQPSPVASGIASQHMTSHVVSSEFVSYRVNRLLDATSR